MGVLVYELLTGVTPFYSKRAPREGFREDTMLNIVSNDPIQLNETRWVGSELSMRFIQDVLNKVHLDSYDTF